MNLPIYKGYSAHAAFSPDDGCFVGHLTGIDDVVGFHSKSDEGPEGLQLAFQHAVDDYLETCRKIKKTPQRAIELRTPDEFFNRAHAHARALDRGEKL